MAINFPDSPTVGNTYEYLDIQYIYRVSGGVGWWAVNTPATVGVATPTEINEGTDNNKYTSPQGLNASKYVREDEITGETVLRDTGDERLRAHRTGVDVTGQLQVNGVTVAYVVDVGSNGNGNWRIWSDKFIEMFGSNIIPIGSTELTVPLPRSEPRVGYQGLKFVNADARFSKDNVLSHHLLDVTDTSFKIVREGSTGSNINFTWTFVGYLA